MNHKTVEEVELPPAPPLATPPSMEPVEKTFLRLDLACGDQCVPGFFGVDIAQVGDVKAICDLAHDRWPFEDSSADEARCSHFLEHLDGTEQIHFMNELYRVLKPAAGCIITTPFGWHERAWQDPTHKRPIFFASYLYYSKEWRELNKLTHGPYATIKADFELRSLENGMDGFWATRTNETRQFAAQFYVNSIPDLNVLLIKKPEAK